MKPLQLGLALALTLASGISAASASDDRLPPGEYSCVGSGGDILLGLGFKLKDDGTYTDLDATTSGSYAIDGNGITFSGGHLDGFTGRDIANQGFTLGEMASCQLWAG